MTNTITETDRKKTYLLELELKSKINKLDKEIKTYIKEGVSSYKKYKQFLINQDGPGSTCNEHFTDAEILKWWKKTKIRKDYVFAELYTKNFLSRKVFNKLQKEIKNKYVDEYLHDINKLKKVIIGSEYLLGYFYYHFSDFHKNKEILDLVVNKVSKSNEIIIYFFVVSNSKSKKRYITKTKKMLKLKSNNSLDKAMLYALLDDLDNVNKYLKIHIIDLKKRDKYE